MELANSKHKSIIAQTNEAEDASDQALDEPEPQKVDNGKQYQEPVKQLKEDQQKLNEKKAIMDKPAASANPIVNLNVGGEKLTTSRATLTLVEGSLLAKMFSAEWEDKLMKDADGRIFLDHDPVLFKWLLNQLRNWSNPSVNRVFRLPAGSEQSFLEFIRLLEFDERFTNGGTSTTTGIPKEVQPEQEVQHSINEETSATASAPKEVQPEQEVQQSINDETSTTASVPQEVQPEQGVEQTTDGGTSINTSIPEEVSMKQKLQRFSDGGTSINTSIPKEVQPEQEVERFQTADTSDVRLTDNDRRCEKISLRSDWQCVFGTLSYSTGIHKIRLKLEKGWADIFTGICSKNKPPTGPYYYDKPTTHGWLINGYVVKNGENPQPGWSQVGYDDILELTINCSERSLSILNERSRAQNSMQVNIDEAPFPWCLLVLLRFKTNRVSLV